jgi:hypothetical protein
MTERIGWFDGVTNQVDRLLDYGRDDGYIARTLSIRPAIVRRRRAECFPTRPPAITPARQLELAIAVLNKTDSTKGHAA